MLGILQSWLSLFLHVLLLLVPFGRISLRLLFLFFLLLHRQLQQWYIARRTPMRASVLSLDATGGGIDIAGLLTARVFLGAWHYRQIPGIVLVIIFSLRCVTLHVVLLLRHTALIDAAAIFLDPRHARGPVNRRLLLIVGRAAVARNPAFPLDHLRIVQPDSLLLLMYLPLLLKFFPLLDPPTLLDLLVQDHLHLSALTVEFLLLCRVELFVELASHV